MSPAVSGTVDHPRRPIDIAPLLVVAGAGASLAIGLMFGFPTPDLRLLGGLVIGALTVGFALLWPFAALQVMFASSLVLVVWVVIGQRAANPIDVLMPPILAAGILGSARRLARTQDAAGNSGADAAIRAVTSRLVRSVWAFFGVAVLSLALLALRGNLAGALDSGLTLSRAIQGVLFFALGLWWLRSDRDIRRAERALQVGGWVLVMLNTWFILNGLTIRAGMTWIINNPEWPMTSPNEAAISLLILWAVLTSRPETRRSPMRILLMAATLIMLIQTQSRSGLLASLVYALLTIPWRSGRSLIAVGAVMISLALLAPASYWTRLSRTLALEGGSFEAYTSMVRVFGWGVAAKVFLAYPVLGAGYLGYRFVSADFNEFRIAFGTAESYYLEVASGMGIVGLVALGFVIHALLRVGAVVRSAAPLGSHGHELARRHTPLVLALLVANLTADNFVGLTGVAQVAIWTVLVIRVGRLSAAASLAGAPFRTPIPAS